MEIIDAIKEKFQVWFLIQRDKYLRKQLASIPSDNPDDYYYDNLTNAFVYKDANLNIQIGWQNTLNVLKTQIEAVNIHTENLEAIIDDIAQVNVDTGNLQAIISNIASMNVNVNNLQAVIANIASIDVDTGNLQAIISNIASMNVNVNNLQAVIANINTMNVNIDNLQAIITDIANIETLNTTISGNITSLTAIIANIGTMNTNIGNLQAIIADIANIETLNTTISGNIATVNTNINNLQAIIANIANIETLTTTISGNITSLTAIIANIGTMNTNIGNLQAIIADIANIETLNTTISGNITSLTAIIANIGTMNTNIDNLQAIITDIANIETQNIAINTVLATINTNIGTINTAITSIEAHQVDIDINIESVKNFELDIINQENKGVKSSDNTLNSGTNITGDFSSSNYLYNQLTIKIYRTTPALTNYELQISIRDTTTDTDSENLSTWIIEKAEVVIRTFTFNPSHDINYYFGNEGGDNIKIDFIFSYSELQQPNIISLDSEIALSSWILPYFNRFNKPINRMRILLKQTGTLNATIILTQRSSNSGMTDELINTTITTGTEYSDFLDFNPCTYFSLKIQNNNGSYPLAFQIILFFSSNLKPELNEHIGTSNIHFLENSINLANLNEKLHASLAEVSESQHHVKTVASELDLANLNEKLHASLAEVSTSQHHVKTVASELDLANLNEKLHASLAEISASQHHVKTVASELDLADLNEKSFNSLTDKPVHRFFFLGSRVSGGWVLDSYYGICYTISATDSNAYLDYSYYVKVGGSYSIQMLYSTSASGSGVASGRVWINSLTPILALSWNKVGGADWDPIIGTGNTLYRATYGNVNLEPNSLVCIDWWKDGSAQGNTLRVYGILIIPNF